MRFSLSVRADECSINVFIEMFERTEAGFLRVTHLLCAAVEIEISGFMVPEFHQDADLFESSDLCAHGWFSATTAVSECLFIHS